MAHGADRPDHARARHLPVPRVELAVEVLGAPTITLPAPRAVPAPERLPRAAG